MTEKSIYKRTLIKSYQSKKGKRYYFPEKIFSKYNPYIDKEGD